MRIQIDDLYFIYKIIMNIIRLKFDQFHETW